MSDPEVRSTYSEVVKNGEGNRSQEGRNNLIRAAVVRIGG